MEYLAVGVLELASNAARDNKKTLHLQLVIRNDEELIKLMSRVTTAQGGSSLTSRLYCCLRKLRRRHKMLEVIWNKSQQQLQSALFRANIRC
nr:unnamed protein product [Callosobruchus chinensis]